MARKNCFFHVLMLPAIAAAFTGGATFVPLSVQAQEAARGAPVVLITTRNVGSETSGFWSKARSDTQSNTGWVGFVSDYTHAGSSPADLGTIDNPASWSGAQLHQLDLIDTYPAMFGPSYDPFKTLEGPNGFAAAIVGLAPRPVDLLRKGSAAVPDAVWVGLAPDTTQTKRGNNFEASMTANFVLGRKTAYPLTITFPAYVALQDEEYFLGPQWGYICAGIKLRAPLSFVPRHYGKWSVGTSADFCYYGTTTTEFVKSIGLQIPKLALALNVEF